MMFLGGVLVCALLSIILTRTLSQDVGSILTKTLFEQMLKHRNDDVCPSKGFYTHEAFIEAAKSFTSFGTTGDIHTRKREIAAFFAQTSFLTWYRSADLSPPDGEYAWGYCLNMIENNDPPEDYCVQSRRWPCVPGQYYFARGPILLTYNYNYGPAGKAIGVDLLANPNLVANDSVISFKTALWFWMTPRLAKPSPHDAMTGGWMPSVVDKAAGRVAGYGLVTNIFDGEIECGLGKGYVPDYKVKFYKRYCDILGVAYGNNLDCATQKPFKRSNHS